MKTVSAKYIEEKYGIHKSRLHYYRTRGIIKPPEGALPIGSGRNYPYTEADILRAIVAFDLESIGMKAPWIRYYLDKIISLEKMEFDLKKITITIQHKEKFDEI